AGDIVGVVGHTVVATLERETAAAAQNVRVGVLEFILKQHDIHVRTAVADAVNHIAARAGQYAVGQCPVERPAAGNVNVDAVAAVRVAVVEQADGAAINGEPVECAAAVDEVDI